MRFLASTPSRGQGGFTLVELLASIVVGALVMVAVAAISMGGFVRGNREVRERHADATTAQWVSVTFARDVQGAAGVAAAPCGAVGAEVVTLQASDGTERVGYRTVARPEGLELVRIVCDGDDEVESRTVVSGLAAAPTATCSDTLPAVPTLAVPLDAPALESEATTTTTTTVPASSCAHGSTPRSVELTVERREAFRFELGATRRSTPIGDSGGTFDDLPRMFAIGGTQPLRVGNSANALLKVNGDVWVNKPTSGQPAIALSGNNRKLEISGGLWIEQGGTCSGCTATRLNRTPGSFQGGLPDPFRFLPAPPATGPTGSCSAGVCTPGIYPSGMSFTSNHVLQPGIYDIRGGLSVTGGARITGAEVFLYIRTGAVSFGGNAGVSLTPPTSGTYEGIVMFQSRTNTSTITIRGTGSVNGDDGNASALGGLIYAPASNGFQLGGGNGYLRLGRVVGANLSVSGNGTVEINGS